MSPDEDRADFLEGTEALSASGPREASSVASFDGGDEVYPAGHMIDHFEIVELIGEGGMGRVYLAADSKLGRRVALKVVRRSYLGSPQAVEGFVYEARTTARFNHPHIVTIYAVGEHDGCPYLALEHVPGQTLRERMNQGRLPLSKVVEVGRAVARALVEAHSHKILHRDLKPANVILATDGRPRVLDFGLAKPTEGASPLSVRMAAIGGPREYTWAGAGTPGYMSPEQWRAEETTDATDIWSFGVMMFQLAAGRRPFDEPTVDAMEKVVCSEAPAPALRDFATAPPALGALVARCLDKHPDNRPSAREVTEALAGMSVRGVSAKRRWGVFVLSFLVTAVVATMGLLLARGPAPTLRRDVVRRETRPEPLIVLPPSTVESDAQPSPAPSTSTKRAPSRAVGPRLPPFDEVRAQSSFRALRSRVRGCRFHPGPRSIGLEVTFDPASGGVTNVRNSLGSRIKAGASGRCAISAATSMRVPPFSGPAQTRSVAVTFGPRPER